MSGMDVSTGRRLSGKAHLQQSIRDVLITPLGSRIQRRDYGSLLPDLIDQPLTDALALQAKAAVVMALTQWEPRIRINQVQLAISVKAGQADLELAVTRLDTGTADRISTSVPRGIA